MKPNFFIIGAPKCGTTSMAKWLSEHPRVFMPSVKEPHFFNTDSRHINTQTEEEYSRLFNNVEPKHLAVGEASVYYLHSSVAVPNIEAAIEYPRYIVMLRNPIEMAPSLHEQKVFSANENVTNFEDAWRLQDKRREGAAVDRYCREPKLLVYGDVCKLGEQLARLYATVSADRVLTVVLDDVKSNPSREYQRVLSFLDVPDDGKTVFVTENAAKVRRSPSLRRIVRMINDTRRRVGIPRIGTGVMSKVNNFNKIPKQRVPLSEPLRAELADYFKEDIHQLAEILGRDLSGWLKGRSIS